MSSPEQDVFSILVVADKEAKQETLKSLAAIRTAQADLVKQVEATEVSYSEAAESLRHLNREQLEQEGILEALEDSWKGNNLQLERYEQRLQSVQRSTELAGSIGGNVGRLGGVASQFGIPGAGEAAGIGTGVTDLLESLPQLKVQMQTLGEVARTSTSKAGKFVTGIGNMSNAIVPGTAAMASFTAVLLPVAIALAGLTFAVYNYNKGMEAQNKILQANLEAVRAVNQAVAEGLTTEQAEQRLAELQRSRAAEAETLATSQAAYDSMTSQLQESLGILSGPITAGIQAFDSREQSLADSVKTSTEAITEMDVEIALLESRLQDGSLAANDLAEEEARLTEERTAAIEMAEAEAESIRSQLENSIQAERDMLKERKDAERDANELEALDRQFALEDQQVQEQEHWANMAKIAADGRTSIQALEQELVNAQAEGLQELKEIDEKGKKEASDLAKEFMTDQIKANKEFAEETKRIEQDTNLERLRLIEDINDRLTDAASSNDVNAFLDAQKEGAKDLRRNSEDANIAEKRRVEDFLKAQQEAQEAYRKQHQEILESTAAEKAAAQEAILERKIAIEEQIVAEKAAIQNAIKEEQKRYAEQERQEAQAASREKQRNDLIEMQEARAFQARLTQINQEQAAWQSTFDTMNAGIQKLKIEANSLLQMSASSYSSSSGSGNSAFSKTVGGQIGFGQKQSANYSFSPQYSTNVGDIASKAQVTEALKQFAMQSGAMFVNFVKNAKNP